MIQCTDILFYIQRDAQLNIFGPKRESTVTIPVIVHLSVFYIHRDAQLNIFGPKRESTVTIPVNEVIQRDAFLVFF